MVRKWVALINYCACGIITLLACGALYFYLMRQTTFSVNDNSIQKSEIPKGAFARSSQEYEAIGAPALSLGFSPLSVQLPDLRRHLVYYGKNTRLDAKEGQPMLYFAFTGNKTPTALFSGERLYLLYDKTQTPPQYTFSGDNHPTTIWLEATASGNQALVKVSMQGETGQIIREPAAYADFSLPEKEFLRFGGSQWELGKWRVDGTLLARQKARWFGMDKFLERHGGEEYKELLNKQRVDFGENDEIYSVYVTQGDCLIWVDGRWQNVKVGDASLNYTLMCVKKIDDRVMNLELWDVDGKGKIALNLIKTNEAWVPQSLENNFKFIGLRTRSQFVFEVNRERMILKPHDWLLLTDSTWKKLTTPKQIDDYVERKAQGPLFVFDSFERKGDRQVISGTLFNTGRTETASFELSLQQGGSSSLQTPNATSGEKKQKIKETNIPSVIKTGNSIEKPAGENAQKTTDSLRANANDKQE